MGDWWAIGTRILRMGPDRKPQWGTTVSEVDRELAKVQVQWDGEGEPRTEDTSALWTPNEEDVDPARGPLAERAAQQGVELDDGNGGKLDQPDPFLVYHDEFRPEPDLDLDGAKGYAKSMADRLDAAVPERSELFDWWVGLAASEVAPLVKKAQEYGGNGRAVDLIEIGRALAAAGVHVPKSGDDASLRYPTEGELSELGIYFYLQGKFARWTAAVAEGRPVSDDTLHDIGIYVRMVQRIRAVGGWPV